MRPLENLNLKKRLSVVGGGEATVAVGGGACSSSAMTGLPAAESSCDGVSAGGAGVGVAADRRQPTSLEAEERFRASSNISLFARDIFKLLWAIASWVSRSVLAAAVTLRSVH